MIESMVGNVKSKNSQNKTSNVYNSCEIFFLDDPLKYKKSFFPINVQERRETVHFIFFVRWSTFVKIENPEYLG